jgi:hypothetical protein
MASNENKPLKGAHLAVNEASLAFIVESLRVISTVMTDELIDDKPITIIQELEREHGWIRADDSFGKKAYVTTPFPCGNGTDGELRIGVVLTKRGVFNVDIRGWGEY